MAETEKLSDMVDNLVDEKPEQAQIAFHDYLQGKMKEVIVPPGGELVDTGKSEE